VSIRDGSEDPIPTHLTFNPKASSVQASVYLFFSSAENRSSFGVILNLTIFLLELLIQYPLHF